MAAQNTHSKNSLTHVMQSPGTNHQRLRGQQEVRGQATDPMNSCFSATSLFFNSFPHPPDHFISLGLSLCCPSVILFPSIS